jgi:hypothetical protein
MKRRALILDRDGVINVDTGYLHRIEDCVLIERIVEMVQAFHERAFTIIVATDHAGIGRGYYGDAELKVLMEWMRLQFEVKIAAVYHCPGHPEGIGAYRRETPRRKAAPESLQREARPDLALPATPPSCPPPAPDSLRFSNHETNKPQLLQRLVPAKCRKLRVDLNKKPLEGEKVGRARRPGSDAHRVAGEIFRTRLAGGHHT